MLHAQVSAITEASVKTDFPFTVRKYNSSAGLPQNSVLGIIPTSRGTYFILTVNGIMEFNGHELIPLGSNKEYRTHFLLKGHTFYHDSILVGSSASGELIRILPDYRILARFEKGVFQSVKMDDHRLLIGDKSGSIYEYDVAKDLVSPRYHFHEEIISLNKIDNYYYIGTGQHLFKVNASFSRKDTLLSDVLIQAIDRNPYDGKLYCLTEKSMLVMDQQGLKTVFEFREISPYFAFNAIAFDGPESMIAIALGGFFHFHKGKINAYGSGSPLGSQHFSSVLCDTSQRIILLGSTDEGLISLERKSFLYLNHPDLTNASANSILRDRNGKIILSASKNNLYEVKGDTAIPYGNVHGVFAGAFRIGDSLFIGTYNGGVHIAVDGKVMDKWSLKDGLPSWTIFSGLKDSKGNIWIGTAEGFYVNFGDGFHMFLKDKFNKKISFFQELSNGCVVAGGHEGLMVFRNKKLFAHIPIQQFGDAREVRCVMEDDHGRLWIGTYNAGLFCYENGHLESLNQREGCGLSPDVFTLVLDKYGFLNMTSNNGLYRVRFADLENFRENRIEMLIPFVYTRAQGMWNPEFNGGFQNSAFTDSEGEIFFPTIRGVVRFNPEAPRRLERKVNFSSILVNDTMVVNPGSSGIQLSRNTHVIEFRYSSPDYSDKYNVYYQYRLEGGEDHWSVLKKDGVVRYNMLPPGDYTFMVRAIDASNQINPPVTYFRFSIQPFFYETTFGVFLLVLGGVVVVLLVFRMRVQFARRRAMERERIRRKMAEIELKAVQSQMNPHFIFNSLNSLKYYLATEDLQKAEDYVDNFSSYLRRFLEISRESLVRIEDEVEMIRNYLDLENMRMHDVFEISIRISPEVKSARIPSMLIQPYIENSVKHGISHADHKCYISVQLFSMNNEVVCLVEDNGIGRRNAENINKGAVRRISFGTRMVEEKVQVIRTLYGVKITIDTIDKISVSGEPLGTLVIIKIPVRI
jgi:ligand-binding sensor domain-containing protein